jgi:hypothetical protein
VVSIDCPSPRPQVGNVRYWKGRIFGVGDVVFVLLTLAVFAVLGLVLKAVEKL